MTNHKIIDRTLLMHFGGQFREEDWCVKCEKTGKIFNLAVSYTFNKKLFKFDDPEFHYSYCPHCAEKLDLKGDD